jgi:hypothetical protein
LPTGTGAMLPSVPGDAPPAHGDTVTPGFEIPVLPPIASGDAPHEAESLPAPKALPEPVPSAPPADIPGGPHAACGVNGPWPPPKDYPGLCGQFKLWLGRCAGSAQDYQPPPFGAVVAADFEPEVANGEAAHLVLYRFDFECDSPALNLHGRDRLILMAPLLLRTPFPLIVERTPATPGLAEARRLAVLHELALAAVPVPPERVVVGPALAVGLSGQEAAIIYQNLLMQTERLGFSPGLGAGAGGPTRTGGSTPGLSTGSVPSTGGPP